MGRYQVGLGDLEKRDPMRRLKALQALTKGPWSPQDLAKAWQVHETTAYRLLARLTKQGYALCDGNNDPSFNGGYTITDQGRQKIEWLSKRQEVTEKAEEASLGETYPDVIGDYSKLVEGPVSLMRVVEIDDISQAVRQMEKRGFSKDDLAVEAKLDGWLCQVAGGRIYSRRGMDLTDNIPPVAAVLGPFRRAHVIGELVYWTPGGKMDEPTVTRVAGTDDPAKAVAKLKGLSGFFQVVLFDVLAWDGKEVTKQPFRERRKLIDGIRISDHLALSRIHPFGRWKEIYEDAPKVGAEGIVLKNRNAPYFWRPLGDREPKPQGVQWKLKHVSTDDFVVFKLSVTEKQSLLLHFGQFWKGKLIPVGEVDNLSKEDEQEMIALFEQGPFVVEIDYQERFPKPPGKLRNPRVRRLRLDKPVESVELPARFAPK